jgi:hypothetical protein
VQVGTRLVGVDGTVSRALEVPPDWPGIDGRRGKDAAKAAVGAWLCQETVRDGHSVLMFCATKRGCQVGPRCACTGLPERLPTDAPPAFPQCLKAR